MSVRELKVTINKPFAGYVEGQTVIVETNSEGVPLSMFWRKRLKESQLDNALTVEQHRAKPKKRNSTNKDKTLTIEEKDNGNADS